MINKIKKNIILVEYLKIINDFEKSNWNLFKFKNFNKNKVYLQKYKKILC
jgi:hypothetical protein